MTPLEPRDSTNSRPHVYVKIGAQNLDPRVSATPPSRWTITPLFYSQSTDLPVLRGRRCVRGALKGPRPVSCKINLRFRRFGYGTGQITGLSVYYI